MWGRWVRVVHWVKCLQVLGVGADSKSESSYFTKCLKLDYSCAEC